MARLQAPGVFVVIHPFTRYSRAASSMPLENILPSDGRQTPIVPLQSAVTVDAAHVACLAGPKPGVSFNPGLVVEPFRGGTCKRAR